MWERLPRSRTTWVTVVAAAVAAAIVLVGIARGTGGTDDDAGGNGERSLANAPAANAPAGEAPAGEERDFALALAATPPRITPRALETVIERIGGLAEYGIIQRSPPWTALFAGESMEAILDREYAPLVSRMRDVGLGIVLLIDPLDPLDRRREPPELVAAGRSILEPEVMAMYEDWVRAVATRVRPAYLGLASEINTPAAHDRRSLYIAIRDATNRLVPDLRAATPESVLFVTFQVDDAWGHLGSDPSVDQFALAAEFDVDLIGLSSYPVFAYASPADIPDDYYRRYADAAGGRPLGQFEGGWASAGAPLGPRASPELQAQWVDRTEELLDGIDARIWAHLQPTDLALDTWDLPADRRDTLRSFASMGLLDTEFEPKPALRSWLRVRARPWAGG